VLGVLGAAGMLHAMLQGYSTGCWECWEGVVLTWALCLPGRWAYDLRGQLTALQASPQRGRNTLACIAHALPLTIRSKDMTELMHGLKSLVDSIF